MANVLTAISAARRQALHRLPLLPVFLFALCMVVDAALLIPQFGTTGFRPDFGVFWTAAQVVGVRPDWLYDFHAMTRAQAWLADPAHGLRPFLYPPSALPLFLGLRLLSFPVAFAVWTGVSLLAFWSIVRRVSHGPVMVLALAAPPVVQALLTGQTTLIVGAMIAHGVSELERRPLIAGIWLGIAAAIKPQTLLMLPVAYTRIRGWRALAGTGVAGLAMAGAAAPFGLALWFDWLGALQRFPQVMSDLGLILNAISPASAAVTLGLGSGPTLLVRIAGVIGGTTLVWWAFGRGAWDLRFTTLMCGAFLASPYAMPYELAVLAPFAAATILRGASVRWLALAPLTGFGGVGAVLGLVVAALIEGRDRPAA